MRTKSPLVLPDTKLKFDGETLSRTDEEGNPSMLIEVESLESIHFTTSISWFGVVLVTTGIMIAYTGHVAAENNSLTVLLYIFGLLVGAFGLFAIQQDKIIVETRTGKISIDASDAKDVAMGFANSVQEHIAKKR